MRLEKVKPFKYNRYSTTKNKAIIDEFISTGYAMAKVVIADKEYKSAESCASSLTNSIRRYNKTNILQARLINGEVYLVNMPIYDKEIKEG